MKLTEKIAYMKGLLDGMELDSSTKEGKAILQIADVIEEMGVYVDDIQNQLDELTELCDLLDHDLGEVETDLYCDDDDEDENGRFDDDDDDDTDFRIGKVLPADSEDFDFSSDDDDDDDEELDDALYVVTCPSCEETVTLSEEELEKGSMVCPHCNELLEFNYDDIETESAEADENGDASGSNDAGETIPF